MSFELIESALNIPLGLLSALCMVETGHRDVVVPHDGGSASIGVCQVKLSTAKRFDSSLTQSKLLKRDVNVRLAGQELLRQYQRYGNWCWAVAAYNAGRLNMHGSGLPRNVRYVRKVERHLGRSLGCL